MGGGVGANSNDVKNVVSFTFPFFQLHEKNSADLILVPCPKICGFCALNVQYVNINEAETIEGLGKIN